MVYGGTDYSGMDPGSWNKGYFDFVSFRVCTETVYGTGSSAGLATLKTS